MSIKRQFVSEIIKKMFDFNSEQKNLIAGTDEEPFLFHISRHGSPVVYKKAAKLKQMVQGKICILHRIGP